MWTESPYSNADRRETVDCPTCAGQSFQPWASENGFAAVKCSDCGTVYVRERPIADSITAANREGVHAGSLDVRFARRGWKVPKYAKVIQRFFPHDPYLRWLDVGAGYGEVVEAVQQAIPNARVEGIDPMVDKVAVAQQRGLRVTARTLADVTEQYDVVSLINVFSHIPDFPAFATDIRRVLKPKGSLFLETGNAGDLDRRSDYPDPLYLPDHLVFVGVEQMYRILDGLGFTDIRHEAQIMDTATWAAKRFVKGLLRARLDLVVPYRSPFRTVFYRAVLS